MEIDIFQKNTSLGIEYSISFDEIETRHVITDSIRRFSIAHLFNNGNAPLATIQLEQRWFSSKKEIIMSDGNIIELKTISSWKPHFRCQYLTNTYDIFSHRGRKFSVYKNDNQIAWWEKNIWGLVKGNYYKMIIDRNANHDLAICFCLIMINTYSHYENDGSFDLGNIGGQARKFDKIWEPKY